MIYYQFIGKDKLKNKNSFNGFKKPDQNLPVEASLNVAINSFQNGSLEEAKFLFNKILSKNPNHAESWFFTALIADHQGLYQNAVKYIEKALSKDPKNLKYLYTLGDFFFTQNYLNEAIELFKYIIKINPDDFNGYYNLAVLQQKQHNYDQSLFNYNKVLELDEKNINAIYNIGNILIDTKDYINAASYFRRVIEAEPNSDDALNNLGLLETELGNLENAIEYFNKAILINSNNYSALNNLGKAYEKKYLYLVALQYFEKAIMLKPDFAEVYSNRGSISNELKDFEAALIDFDKAIDLNPNMPEAHSNRGIALKELMRYEEALEAYANAISLNPNYAEAYTNKGVVLEELARTQEAMDCYDSAIFLDPDYADAYYNKAILLLLLKKLDTGWALYNKWRWKAKLQSAEKLETKIPDWNGLSNNQSIKIIFWAEQGIGDEIFYFGVLKNFTEINAKITIAADNRLHTLFKRSMPEVQLIDRNKIVAECNENSFDYQAPIGDIGHLCSVDKVLEHKIPKPFLHINNFKYSDIKTKNHLLKDRVLCGLSWKSVNKNIGFSKSLDLIEFSPLLLIEEVEFVSLQYGSTKDEIEFVENKIGKRIHTVDDLDIHNDIDGLVSLISNCDFVITTSNITAHLTGSIGKKGMVLLPFSKGRIWYWHTGEGQSVWYPSLELASQKQMNDWSDPINQCKEWLITQL